MFCFLLTTLLLHPVHETLSEIEWNGETRRLEVALRIDPLDEQWLKKKLRGDDRYAQWVPKYLESKFRVTDRAKNKEDATYHWIGRDDKGSHVWWYFEIQPADRQRPQWIEQRMLFERDEKYVNRVLILGQVPKRALTLTIQRPKAFLDPAKNEQPKQRESDRRSRLDR